MHAAGILVSSSKRFSKTVFCFVFVTNFIAPPAHSAVQPIANIKFSEHYRSVELPVEDREFVSEAAPTVGLKATTARLEANVNYTYRLRAIQDNGSRTDSSQSLLANGSGRWLHKSLTLGANATIGERVQDPLGTISLDSIGREENRTEVWAGGANANFKRPLGRLAVTSASYRFNKTLYRETATGDSESQSMNAALSSGRSFARMPWSLSWQRTVSSFPVREDVTSDRYNGRLGFVFGRKFSVFADGGFERNSGIGRINQRRAEGEYYKLTVNLNPTTRNALSGSYGHRYFGDTYNASFSYRTRQSQWSATYMEDVTTRAVIETELVESMFVLTPEGDVIVLENIPIGRLIDVAFLRRRGQVQGSVTLRNIKLNASAYHERRGYEENFGSERLYGATAGAGLALGRKMNINLSGNRRKSTFVDLGRYDWTSYYSLSITRSFGRHVSSSADVRYLERDSNQPSADHREMVYRISVSASL